MSTDAMQSSRQYRQVPTTSSYATPQDLQFDHSQMDAQGYYSGQNYYPPQPTSDHSRYTPQDEQIPPGASYDVVTTLPYHSRSQSAAHDQYDGAPIPPPRISSQQQNSPRAPAPSTAPLEARVAASRHTRQVNTEPQSARSRHQNMDHQDEYKDLPLENPATSAASAARSRRRGPPSPDSSQGISANAREAAQYPSVKHSRPEPHMPSPGPPGSLVREHSEVINRVVVSDPQVDAQRLQERVAEAQPAPIAAEPTLPDPSLDDVLPASGPQRRQDYSKSRRKDVQFGDYMLGQTLGEGEFGKVKLGWKKDGTSQVAIKLIRRETVASNPSRLPKIYREISILRDLAHPNIVRLHEMVETERHIGIILEYASGGELFDYILNNRYLKDPAARRLFAQLVSGVGYLHKKGIVHRDLKLENLLLDQNKNIIITDFGFANNFDPKDELADEIVYNLGNKDFVRKYKLDRLDARGMRRGDLMQTSCGSPCYAAPELVVSDSLYTGKKVDVWSCGVILYAMLAGYLPFDDDPANPEGDNINLLYKYITTTPLTFPEYVTPHARDLLRRILVPDPRKRADLFEVARHSWLSEYHHVVSHITSSTTNVADIAHTTVPAEDEPPTLNRSASVREGPSRSHAASPGTLARAQEGLLQDDESSNASRRGPASRHTLQPEYVAPQTHTARTKPVVASTATSRSQAQDGWHPENANKPLPQEPPTQQSMKPPTRPARDIPRSVSDSTSAFGTAPIVAAQSGQYTTRPSTQGSLTSASGPTRSDLRLPSRGSYGQPVAPTVATTNAQGRVTQPSKPGRGYNISGPLPSPGAQGSIGQPTTTPMPPPNSHQAQKSHHRRSSTLSGLGERIFGRSNSVVKKDGDRQRNGRKYPPTSMKEYPPEGGARMSTDSRRSFSFGLGKKRSTELESPVQTEKSEDNSKPSTPLSSTRPDSMNPQIAGHDGTYDSRPTQYSNFSRPPQSRYSQPPPPTASASNDVYGGTGIYQPQGRAPHHRQQSEPMAQLVGRSGTETEQPGRPSMQQGRQGRGVLVKNNRKFTEAYDNEHGPTHHAGRSGAVKKVQDFFRRRRTPVDGEYR
ncbi:hypothetical protein, variant [Exophiala mesophila]|uniref:non-specific serine/threonine protein kinase n=1 Tax=Exophiala mesophila TaxID=212818 RepID=A0A0D1Y525_EXOME|nr:hypothetical protein, variant [Exophiala mesophila]KIV95791.1 hypothetical protein, variant [Exophiala mesophila]